MQGVFLNYQNFWLQLQKR